MRFDANPTAPAAYRWWNTVPSVTRSYRSGAAGVGSGAAGVGSGATGATGAAGSTYIAFSRTVHPLFRNS